MDRKLLGISRRYEKRFNTVLEDEATSEAKGYESYEELARDLEGVIDVVWVSGTRTKGCRTLDVVFANSRDFFFSFTSDALPPHHRTDILHLSCTLPILSTANLSTASQT